MTKYPIHGIDNKVKTRKQPGKQTADKENHNVKEKMDKFKKFAAIQKC